MQAPETSQLPPEEPAKRGALFRVSSFIDNSMRDFFFRIGWLVAGNPFKTILFSLLLMVLCLAGMLRFRTESRAAELWVPQGTVALDNQQFVDQNYGRTVRTSSIVFVARDGQSLATKSALLEMVNVAEAGFKITADPIDEEGADNTIITFPERCLVTADKNGRAVCRTISAFNLFYSEDTTQLDDNGDVDFFATVRAYINSLDDATIRQILENQPDGTFDGSPFITDEILGGVSGSGSSFSVSAMRYTQLTQNNAIVEDGELVDKEADALEEQWTTTLVETSPLLEGRSIDWFVESLFAQEDALSDALSGDLPLLSAGFVLLAIYVIAFLGDFHAVRSHMLLAIAALATTGIALGACFGISSALGMFYGPVHQILPLLIIGIGIDDCFHLTRAADDINRNPRHANKSNRLRIALAISQSGSSITVTSFTNVVVFLLSSISKLPALRFFALWAAIGIFFAWAYAITFYTAFLSLDMRRSDAKRRDCCPCFPPVREVKELNWFKKPSGGFSRFFGDTFGPFIMRPVVRIIILVLFAAGLAVCSYGTSRLYLKFQFSFFYPDGSDIREYQDVIDEYYELGDPTNIYVRDRDLSTTENQRRLLNLCAPEDGVLARNEWLQRSSVDCWYAEMRDENDIADGSFFDSETFSEEVRSFIRSGPGARYEDDILFNSDNNVIGCRIAATYIHRETNDDEITALKSVREASDSVGFGDDDDGNPAAFPYTFQDTFTEQYDALPGEIGISLGLAVAAVALVCFILVGHPIVAAVCVLVVGMIIIDVLGLTNFSGTNLNSVSVITLVLSTGISVDFVVHIARSFLEQVGTRKERAIKALATMGPPVFYAGFSTFLAIVILAFAKSYIFQVIFRGFLFLIIMGFLHGLILCPVILSLIGPGSFYASEEEKLDNELALEKRAAGLQGQAEEKTRELEQETEGESV